MGVLRIPQAGTEPDSERESGSLDKKWYRIPDSQ